MAKYGQSKFAFETEKEQTCVDCCEVIYKNNLTLFINDILIKLNEIKIYLM